jgi:hypothetical protein
MWSVIARWWGGSRDALLARRLEQRGAGLHVVTFCRDRIETKTAWTSCPRVDWALEIAVCVGVERALVNKALSELASDDDPDLVDLGARYEQTKIDGAALLEASVPLLFALLESHPELHRAHKTAERDGYVVRRGIAARQGLDEYDEAYARMHERFCDVFRRHVTTDAVVFALEGPRSHPYR